MSDPLDWEDRPDSVPFWRHAFAGSLAGITEHVGMFPIDTVKTRMQASSMPSSASVMSTMQSIKSEVGVLGFWRGASVIGAGCIPAHCGLFTTYELGKDYLGQDEDRTWAANALCGATASTVHDVILTPHDVVKQRLQLGCYTGPWNCLSTMLRTEGVGALYRSLPVTLISNAPNVAVLASVNEAMKGALGLDRATSADRPWFFLCGGIAGAAGAAATCPLDVVKTRVQTAGALSQTQDLHEVQGAITVARSIMQKQGFSGFYAGMAPRMIVAAPAAALCWGTYETVQSLLCRFFDEEKSFGKVAERAAERAAAAADSVALAAGVGAEDDDDPYDWEHWDPTQVPLWKHMLAGSAAGIMEHVAMYPVDTVKTQMQAVTAVPGAPPPSVRGAITAMVEEQGIAAFFRGCTAIGAACIPAHIGLFGTYELTKYWLLKPGAEKEHAPLRAATCGALSTVVHDSIIVPMDVVKQRMQLGCYSGTWSCITGTYNTGGLMAFYRSLPSTLLMECPFYAILVASNESLKLVFKMEGASRLVDRSGSAWYFASAGLSGIIASAITQPLDVIKTRLQTQEILRDMARDGAETTEVRYRGLVTTFASVLREEGVRGLYRGTLPRMVFAAPSAAMCWGTYDAVKKFLSNIG